MRPNDGESKDKFPLTALYLRDDQFIRANNYSLHDDAKPFHLLFKEDFVKIYKLITT